MRVADAVEKWARAHRSTLDAPQIELLRSVWSTLRYAEAGGRELDSLSAIDRSDLADLFEPSDRPGVESALDLIVEWAAGQTHPQMPDGADVSGEGIDVAEGDVAEGDAANLDAAEGDAANLDAAEDDVAEGDVAEADGSEGDVAEADGSEGDVVDLDAAEDDVVDLDAAEDDAAEDDAAEGDVAEGDVAEGDAAEGDAAEGDVAVEEHGGEADEAVAGDADAEEAPESTASKSHRPSGGRRGREAEADPPGVRAQRRRRMAERSNADDGTDSATPSDPAAATERRPVPHGVIVTGVTIAAAGVAAFAPGEPTGLVGWDHVLKAVMAALFVFAVSRAPNWVAVATSTAAMAFIGRTDWLIPVWAGLLIAASAALFSTSNRWMRPEVVRAVAAAFAVQGLLRLPPIGFFGLPSIIAAAAIVLALGGGYRQLDDLEKHLARRATAAIAVLTAAVCAVGGIVMLTAKGDVDRGVAAARDGLSAARGGDPEAVVASLEEAAEALSKAESRTDSIWTQPLRLVPVAAQHRDAVTVATGHGSSIARQASKATIDADVSEITMAAGSVDLDALAGMSDDLTETAALLETGIDELTEAQSPWLISPIAARMESLTDEMRSVLPEAQIAAEAAEVLPGLLGSEAPRRYLVAFGSPAESRELGGFVGSWALIEFDDGDVSQVDAGRVSDLYDLSRSNAPLGPLGYPEWYVYRAVPEFWPQNITSSPQLSMVTSASLELFDGLGGGQIDGFVYVDGYALAALLELTGGVRVDELDQRISSRNAVDFFFDGQYRVEDRDELKDDLTAIFSAAFQGLLDTRLPGPEQLGRVLGPVARQGRLQVMTADEAENAFLRSVKLQRTFGVPRTATDAFAVIQANGTASKLDLYLERNVDYDVVVDESGVLTGTVGVTMISDIPEDAPEYTLGAAATGRNLTYLSLYSPHELDSVTIDDEVAAFRRTEEFGYNRFEVLVELPAGETRVVEFVIAGSVAPTRDYTVAVWQQPLVNNDMVEISYRGPDGGSRTEAFELVETTTVDFGE